MTNRNFTHRRLAATLALVTAVIWPGLLPAASARPLTHAAASGADLKNEARVLESYVNDLAAYHKQCAALSKKPSVARAEFDALERKANELKNRWPNVQNALREAIRKLKDANEFNNLDATLLAKETDARRRTFLQQIGPRRSLESAANASGLANEIGAPLNTLRPKLTARTFAPSHGFALLPAAYRAPAGVKAPVTCTLGGAAISILAFAGINRPDLLIDVTSCACNGTSFQGALSSCDLIFI